MVHRFFILYLVLAIGFATSLRAQQDGYSRSTRELSESQQRSSWATFLGFDFSPAYISEREIDSFNGFSTPWGGASLGPSLGFRKFLKDRRQLNFNLQYRLHTNPLVFNTMVARAEHEWRPRNVGFAFGLGAGAWWSGERLRNFMPSPQSGLYLEPGIHMSVSGPQERAEFIFGLSVSYFEFREEWLNWDFNTGQSFRETERSSFTILSFRIATRFGFWPLIQFKKDR
ncbi:MAG: hypothetical protein ACOCZ8_00990 [Bacteroidota bacterium]